MSRLVPFLLQHGYLILFGVVFVEQAAVPIPAVPVLLAMGALAGTGKVSLATSVAVAVAACLTADFIWYRLGRSYGSAILRLMCRISLEPVSCVRRAENVFAREGGRTLLYAKFVPGLNAVSTPVAGMARLSPGQFLLWDGAGAAAWTTTYLALGYAFSPQIEKIAEAALAFGLRLVVAAVGGLALYFVWKLDQRRRLLKELEVARIGPDELFDLMQSGREVVVVDLRNALERDESPATVPGAIMLAPEELDERHPEIPREREVVLFCT